MDLDLPSLSRRALLGGTVAAGVGAGATLLPQPAEAAPALPASTPSLPTSYASTPVAGITYTYLSAWDFAPTDSGATTQIINMQRRSTQVVTATFRLPDGAVLYDVETYHRATVVHGMATYALAPGGSATTQTSATTMGAGDGSAVVVNRTLVSTSVSGPYPSGTTVIAQTAPGSDGYTYVLGVRVGYRPAGLQFVPLSTPIRLLDTRPGRPAATAPGTKLAADGTYTLPVTGRAVGGVSIPAGAAGAVLNVTVVGAPGSGYLTIYPGDVATRPTVSTLDFVAGQTLANGTSVRLAADGTIKIYSYGVATDAIVDATGYFA